MTIAGAVLGSLINKLLPGWLLTLLLMVVLGAITVKTTISGKKKWAEENKAKARKVAAIAEWRATNAAALEEDKEAIDQIIIRMKNEERFGKKGGADETTALNIEAGHDYGTSNADAGAYTEPGFATALSWDELSADEKKKFPSAADWDSWKANRIEQYLKDESYSFPCFKLSLLIFVWIGVNVLDLFRGGGGYHGPFDIDCGDVGYWIFTFLYIPFTVAIAAYVALYLMADTKIKDKIGYPWVEGDVQWNLKRSIVFPLICSTAGIFAGMFGVGGGIVKGPLMNEMGVLPEVTQATAAFMIFFTASAATVSFALYGMIIWSYAFVFLVLGFLVTAVGQIGVFWLVEKLGRPSIIIYVIAAILGASAILLAYNGFSMFAAELSCGCHETYHVCG